MNKLLQYMFVVQYDYRDSTQATRARILLPLVSILALLAFVFAFYALVMLVLGLDLPPSLQSSGGALIIPVLMAWTGTALWMTQRGHVRLAASMIALLLGLAVARSLHTDGIAPSAVLTVPLLLLFMGLTYSTWGIVLTTLLSWVVLPAVAYLQSEGQLIASAQDFDPLLAEALTSAQMITLAAVVFWVFAWNLQNALARTSRIAGQMRATAAAGQTFGRILNLDELLTNAVDLIRDRFAYYHVQIFMLDERNEYAQLVASTGDAGAALLAQGFRVPLRSRTGVGEVARTGSDHYLPDTSQTDHRHPELLADTRAELVLPLRVADDIVGVLDIQSARTNAFSQEDIETMRVVANQVSQAIQNARLFESQQRSLLQNRRLFLESETNLHEIERLNRQLTAQSWEDYMLERNINEFGIHLSGDSVQNELPDLTPAMQQAIERQRPVNQNNKREHILAVPITIRGQAIGAVEVRLENQHNPAEVHSILQAVTERMAFSLENARLFEQAHVAAEREQQINQVSAQLQGLTTVDDVMMTAVSALGEVLQAEYGAIRLAGRDQLLGESGNRPPANNGDTPHNAGADAGTNAATDPGTNTDTDTSSG